MVDQCFCQNWPARNVNSVMEFSNLKARLYTSSSHFFKIALTFLQEFADPDLENGTLHLRTDHSGWPVRTNGKTLTIDQSSSKRQKH